MLNMDVLCEFSEMFNCIEILEYKVPTWYHIQSLQAYLNDKTSGVFEVVDIMKQNLSVAILSPPCENLSFFFLERHEGNFLCLTCFDKEGYQFFGKSSFFNALWLIQFLSFYRENSTRGKETMSNTLRESQQS